MTALRTHEYDRHLRRISPQECADLLCNPAYRILRSTEACGLKVECVWTGSDYATEGPPLVFATLVYDQPSEYGLGLLPGPPARHTSEWQALSFFEVVVDRINSGNWYQEEEPDEQNHRRDGGRGRVAVVRSIVLGGSLAANDRKHREGR